MVCGQEAWRDGWSWQRRLEGQRTVEAGRKCKADLQLVQLAVCWRVGRSCSGCPHSGARGGFWGHHPRAEGRLSSPAFPPPGWEAGMAHPARAGELNICDTGAAGGCGAVAALRRCGCGAALTPTRASYKGARVRLSAAWDSSSIPLSFQAASAYSTYT